MTNDDKTVVYSAQGEGVTRQEQAVQPVQTGQAVPAGTQAADQVEYQPVAYADPGEVTEQFDHLATRDPEQMLTEMGSGNHAAQDSAELQPGSFSPEAAALAGGNEVTHHNFEGAVTRVESGNYDLADPHEQDR
ncbi:hypothetical protein Deipr_0600 [Deinococcus proteolyticus MRP]|uniref:Uncharacterized protein n=1 Tax=Deinococcus proteolyticus (strain ATCC 35074 / DSM 20540 / JCM 6276 / NBRC 101906 / NCIMB 13154 / VKM Ac-1939 / CCM 2703 / MRP) TaxID=693977 RepID=F0RKY9_DEIPM|nr:MULTISPECIES: hypothetical protein [Deinococcus]ADY25762.1 hypothetical protein Deipr_0600 [Deinococcus proteolyticus MRP]MCY1701886.1 hypothetical protein [Deinococcus sp. SL84]